MIKLQSSVAESWKHPRVLFGIDLVEESAVGLAGTGGMELTIPETTVVGKLLECLQQQLLCKNVQVFQHFSNQNKYTGNNQLKVSSSWNPSLFTHDPIFADNIHLPYQPVSFGKPYAHEYLFLVLSQHLLGTSSFHDKSYMLTELVALLSKVRQ